MIGSYISSVMMSAQHGFILNGNQIVIYLYFQLLTHTESWRSVLNNKIKLSFTAALARVKLYISFLDQTLKVSQSKISIQRSIKSSKVFRVDNIYSTCWESVIQQLPNAC